MTSATLTTISCLRTLPLRPLLPEGLSEIEVDLAHGLLFTCLCLFTPQFFAASAFRCLPLRSSRAHMGTTEWNCSYYKGTLLSARHSLQQLRAGAGRSPCRPPQKSHMSQVLCLAHRPRSVLPNHKFWWSLPALPQMTFCQLRSLRLPRNSPFAAFLERCIFVNALPQRPVPTPSGCRYADFSHTVAFRDVSTQLSFRELSAPPSTLDVRFACA